MPVDYDELKKDREQPWRVELRNRLTAKERTALPRVKMSEQPPQVRNRNFSEVNLGLKDEQATAEARRCLDCPNPTCISGCPVNINIPGFIKQLERGDFAAAVRVLKETNSLPAVCGRVCPRKFSAR